MHCELYTFLNSKATIDSNNKRVNQLLSGDCKNNGKSFENCARFQKRGWMELYLIETSSWKFFHSNKYSKQQRKLGMRARIYIHPITCLRYANLAFIWNHFFFFFFSPSSLRFHFGAVQFLKSLYMIDKEKCQKLINFNTSLCLSHNARVKKRNGSWNNLPVLFSFNDKQKNEMIENFTHPTSFCLFSLTNRGFRVNLLNDSFLYLSLIYIPSE